MNSTKNIDYVKKINKLGKVSKIILIIMRIVCIVAIVATIVSGIIVLATVPKNSTAITSKGNAAFELIVDTNKLPSYVSAYSDDEDNTNVKFRVFGTEIAIKDTAADNDGVEKYTVEAYFNSPNSTLFKYGLAGACFGVALYAAITLIVVIFAGKLAKALEVCQSPFEESVTKAMKHFAFSLIPAVLTYITQGAINLTMVLIIIAVIIFSYIFSYGAKLQQESDETL